MYYTVQELMAQIKGWEYLIGFACLGVFLAVWLTLGRERRPRRASQATTGPTPVATPCWEVHNCPEEVRDRCPAHALSPLPCWVARPLAEGNRMESCDTCPTYMEGIERVTKAVRRGSSGQTAPKSGSAA